MTGVSSGIGRAVALDLLGRGWQVHGLSRRDPGISDAAFTYLHADLFLPTDMDLIGEYIKPLGLDALVHAAAVRGPVGPLRGSDSNAWQTCIQVNLMGTYELVRAVLPALEQGAAETGDARMLLFSGGGAFNPRPNYSAYAVSKAGVVSLMETLAAELQGTSVTVNCVAPGYVPTPIHGLPDAESSEMALAVACITRLLSPECRGLTGKTISAVHDAWTEITPETVEYLNANGMGSRDRRKIYPIEPNGVSTRLMEPYQIARKALA